MPRSETRNKREWIDVKDRLPENTGEVLVTGGEWKHGGPSYAVAWWDAEYGIWEASYEMLDAGDGLVGLDETPAFWMPFTLYEQGAVDES